MSNIKFSVLFIMLPVCAYMYRVSVMLFRHHHFGLRCLCADSGWVVLPFVSAAHLAHLCADAHSGAAVASKLSETRKQTRTAEIGGGAAAKSLQVSKDELYTLPNWLTTAARAPSTTICSTCWAKRRRTLYDAAAAFSMEEKCKADVIKDYFPESHPLNWLSWLNLAGQNGRRNLRNSAPQQRQHHEPPLEHSHQAGLEQNRQPQGGTPLARAYSRISDCGNSVYMPRWLHGVLAKSNNPNFFVRHFVLYMAHGSKCFFQFCTLRASCERVKFP